jgi:glycogen(starch) synthase
MFGWEFPPIVSGGLGVACHGIVQGLLDEGIDIKLILPFSHKNMPLQEKTLQYVNALEQTTQSGKINTEFVDALLQPYLTTSQYNTCKAQLSFSLYGHDLWAEVDRYAKNASLIAKNTDHDIIHAHDWLTVKAGIAAKKISGKPLFFHVHALEQDRNPQNPNTATCAIERQGLEEADVIIAVSQYTKNKIIDAHHIAASKIVVVYNGHLPIKPAVKYSTKRNHNKFSVLFLGRITEQKGSYYFIEAANKILKSRQDIEFIIAGEGDQLPFAISRCARLGISSHMHFTGFLNRDDVNKFFELSDVFVMPSVSEPVGIVCLEAIAHGTPVVISKQSGVSEVITHSLKADYWDTDQLASKILALLDYPSLQKEMLVHAKRELEKLTWAAAAKEIIHHYIVRI